MAHPSFHVTVHTFELVQELDGSWTSADFRQLLEQMDYGDSADLADDELREMTVASLQDLALDEASALLLQHRLGDVLKPTQIRSLAHETDDEKLWEHHANMQLHERFFHVGSLLYQAFPDAVPAPDAIHVRLSLAAVDPAGERLLTAPLHESFLVRLLAHGMPKTAMLKRLFEEALQGAPFPEAESIVWTWQAEPQPDKSVQLELVGSKHWFGGLKGAEAYESQAFADD